MINFTHQIITILLTSLSTTSLIAIALWISRTVLIERITRSINHEYDKKLHIFNSNVDSKYNQLSIVQSALLQNYTNISSNIFERKIAAIESIWQYMMKMQSIPSPSFVICDIVLDAEYSKLHLNQSIMDALSDLKYDSSMQIVQAGNTIAENARLLSGEYLYAIFFAYRALHGRLIEVFLKMKELNSFSPWITDKGIHSIALQVLDEEKWIKIKSMQTNRFLLLRREFENTFIRHAENVISGKASTNEGLQHGLSIIEELASMQKAI
jgi:hypothetical protein